MSDDAEAHSHQNIQHNGETYIKLSDASETFKNLRAWRVALYNALTEWHDPPRDGETPKAALRRLVHTEILAALDPAISRPAADLVATARREGMDEAAKKADAIARRFRIELPEKWKARPGGIPKDWMDTWEACAETAEEIAAASRAAAKEGK